jgi:hypothetical protein
VPELALLLKNKSLSHQVLTADQAANGGNVPVVGYSLIFDIF